MTPIGSRVVIVAAHPDDEALGLGLHLNRFRDLAAIVHVTDGAPRHGDDVRNAGCGSWQEYAALRRHEFEAAMAMAGVTAAAICLGCPDQQASFQIAEIARRLTDLFAELSPAVVFTHPYEGGHPDHDATAAAVHAAARLEGGSFALCEFASYHSSPKGLMTEAFLPNGTDDLEEHALSEAERQTKRKILSCYQSQHQVLQQFPLRYEPTRIAPAYNFTEAPHAGILHYEHYDWGVKGEQWRQLAATALRELGILS